MGRPDYHRGGFGIVHSISAEATPRQYLKGVITVQGGGESWTETRPVSPGLRVVVVHAELANVDGQLRSSPPSLRKIDHPTATRVTVS